MQLESKTISLLISEGEPALRFLSSVRFPGAPAEASSRLPGDAASFPAAYFCRLFLVQLFVVSTPERLGEGAELHLHAGSSSSSGQAVLLCQMCVHGLWEGRDRNSSSSIPLTLLSPVCIVLSQPSDSWVGL